MNKLGISEERIKLWKEQGAWECEVCGCTEMYGCSNGCYWIEKNLCSNCNNMIRKYKNKNIYGKEVSINE